MSLWVWPARPPTSPWLPYVFNFNPFSWYLGVTAGNLFDFMFPPFFS